MWLGAGQMKPREPRPRPGPALLQVPWLQSPSQGAPPWPGRLRPRGQLPSLTLGLGPGASSLCLESGHRPRSQPPTQPGLATCRGAKGTSSHTHAGRGPERKSKSEPQAYSASLCLGVQVGECASVALHHVPAALLASRAPLPKRAPR